MKFGGDSNLVAVPEDLEPITTQDSHLECDPRDVGMTHEGVEKIWAAVEAYYRTGLQPAITMVLRRHGQVVMRRAIGHARGNGPRDHDQEKVLATPDTPICLFSASKAVTAMLIHKLVELGSLRLDDPVTRYIPEYGAHGKGDTTLRHLLTHRAGIPQLAIGNVDVRILYDWDAILRLLCEARPVYRRDTLQAYHAINAGFIVGEIARRVTGSTLPQLLKKWIAAPLRAKYLSFGLGKARRADAAINYHVGPITRFPFNVFARRILGVPFERVIEVSNDEAFLSSIIPSGNMYATADEMSRLFQMMLNGGELDGRRLFQPDTIAEAIRPYGGFTIDRSFMLPLRFSAGMVLGEWPLGLYGPDCPHAYGHLGFMTCLCWADPRRDIAVGFLTTGKSLSPTVLLAMARILTAINFSCPVVRNVRDCHPGLAPR
jgi:CubicO group peptidase (beta-lactamase class C family)